MSTNPQPKPASAPDESDLIRAAAAKDEAAIRTIMKQHNRRLFRVARSVLRDDGDAEDAVQDAYVRAFQALAEFRGESSLGTWLTRIVLNEALQRRRARRNRAAMPVEPQPAAQAQVISFPLSPSQPLDPERTMLQRELFRLLERAIDRLPDEFRTVLVARVIEGLSVEETAESLDLQPETVKTRLHRTRHMLRNELAGHLGGLFAELFPFDGRRCERFADAVVARLDLESR